MWCTLAMKTSISIPDDLWDCVKDSADGPSAVVRQALTLLCQQSSDPMAHAPSDSVKERVRDAVALQVERIAGEARRWSECGYELGVSLAGHLSLAELLSLPTDQSLLQRWIRGTLVKDFYFDGDHAPLDNFAQFREDADLSFNWLYSAEDFWKHLDLALHRHLEAAGEVVDREDWEESWGGGGSTFLVIDDTDDTFQWSQVATPAGWQEPIGQAGIGLYFLSEGHLPDAYLNGLAGALIDIRAAAAAYGGAALESASESVAEDQSASDMEEEEGR